MICRIAFGITLLCPFALGCGGLYGIATRNLCNEAKLARDEERERLRYVHLAQEAWKRIEADCPGRSYSVDYRRGFKAGFVDYLHAGGTGEPPALPPTCYRHFHAESPGGVQGLQDWYAGFRHGSATAKESGLRQFVLVSLPPMVPPPLPPPPLPLSGTPSGEPGSTGPSLPLPRVLPAVIPEEPKVGDPNVDSKGTPDSPRNVPEASSSPGESEPTKERLEEKPVIEESATENAAGETQP